MCTHQRWITNKYTGQKLFVKCNHCKSCLQEKANSRANRIHNEVDPNRIMLLLTLTYDRDSSPYITESELHSRSFPLNVYRAYYLQRVMDKRTGRWYRKRVYNPVVLTSLDNPDYTKIGKMHSMKFRFGRYSVCYMKDFQDFIKNLRHILHRKFNCYEKFKYFNAFEYGEYTQRSHLHCLVSIPSDLYEVFRDAICQAWPFANLSRQMRINEPNKRPIQIAKDAAGYVASYVNCGSDFPLFLANNFAPKHSHSKLYGHNNPVFSFSEIQKKVAAGSLLYTKQGTKDGVPVFVDLPIPKYIIIKFYPIFKGYSRLNGCEVSNYIYDFKILRRLLEKHKGLVCPHGTYSYVLNLRSNRYYSDNRYHSILSDDKFFESRNLVDSLNYLEDKRINYARNDIYEGIDYSPEDLDKIEVRLDNAFARYHRLTGQDRFQYAQDFVKTWLVYKATSHKYWRLDDISDEEKFYNWEEYSYRHMLDSTPPDIPKEIDPNKYVSNVSKSLRLETLYDQRLKQKKVTNVISSKNQFRPHKNEGIF